MFDTFKAKAEAAGAEVHRFAGVGPAIEFLPDFLRREGVADQPGATAVWPPGPILRGLDTESLAAALPGLKFDAGRRIAKDARVGITEMEWGIADTGTLVQDATAPEQRLASALPWIHVALLRTGRILPDLATLLGRVKPERAGFLAFVTGPSKTADIERVLAIGVHGPGRLVVVCIDEPAEADR